ncbi:MAG: adenylate kinase [Methanophagales archaeon]|nr:adenylate kinase [Methanophagales archaeon]MCW3140793.1 adenylate kinase [Methanophagales archaeon]
MILIIVTGMPGAGSSTVIKKGLQLRTAERSEGIEFIPKNYGDIMFETAREKGLVEKRDELRKLPGEKQREIQMLACNKIAEWRESMNLIIDTHCTIKTPSGYLPGLPEYVLRELNPDQFVLIEASPDEIFERRSKDKTRERDVEDKTSIEEHQFMNRAMSMAYACLTGASVKIIENHDGALDKAAAAFFELMKMLSKS